MKNVRGAGRKPLIDEFEINRIKDRIDRGESVKKIAEEYGVSRQALYKRLKNIENQSATIEYLVDGIVTTLIEVDFRNESIHVENFGDRISKYAFGINQNPNWRDFSSFLENQIMHADENADKCKRFLCKDSRDDSYSINSVSQSNENGIRIKCEQNIDKAPRFVFEKKDILYSRTDTDGYQLKALSKDRKVFVKSQAIIAGELMNDWAVEIVASDICNQLGIPCVQQHECEFVYGDRVYKGVYSDNFELDGYTFVSFERLIERMGMSSKDAEFIHLDAIDKLKWCAEKLSKAGNIEYDKSLKYMLDLVVIDCLVGNVDRHTKNFGLFYNSLSGEYEIPLIFDNGMGLFENDGYRDKYSSYDAAMMNVYVAPYGEDPFDMMDILMKEFDLTRIYPGLTKLQYKSYVDTPYARIYMERMQKIWQK